MALRLARWDLTWRDFPSAERDVFFLDSATEEGTLLEMTS